MAKHLKISGRVQGVGYRYNFHAQARRLQVSGWVRNRADGSVEAIVAGSAEALEQIAAWAWRGPAGASVTQVAVTEIDDALLALEHFEIRATE